MTSELGSRGHTAQLPSADQGDQLQAGATPTWAIFGVALAILAPASTLGLAIGTVAASAGALTWLTWLVTSFFVLSFGGAIAWLARRFSTAGGVYGLVAHTGNRSLSFAVLLAQLRSVLIAGPACVIGSAIYLRAWLGRSGAPEDATWLLVLCGLVATAGIVVMGLRELKVSATLLLVLEFLTVGVILVLFVLVLFKSDAIIDHRQFQFSGASPTTILTLAAFSIYSMAGFENAATLGKEARDPRRGISFAVMASIGTVAVMYVIGSYVFILGTRGVDLSASAAPLDALASHIGEGWLGYAIDLGVAISFFGSAAGILAASSRSIHSLAQDGLLPASLTRVNVQHRTPVAAVAALAVFYVVVVTLASVLADGATAYGALGTFSGYCLVVVYGLCAVAAGLYAFRAGSVGPGILVSLVVSVAGMVIVFYYSFHPFPVGTYRTVAVTFLVVVAVAAVTLVVLIGRRSRFLDLIGDSDRETASPT